MIATCFFAANNTNLELERRAVCGVGEPSEFDRGHSEQAPDIDKDRTCLQKSCSSPELIEPTQGPLFVERPQNVGKFNSATSRSKSFQPQRLQSYLQWNEESMCLNLVN